MCLRGVWGTVRYTLETGIEGWCGTLEGIEEMRAEIEIKGNMW